MKTISTLLMAGLIALAACVSCRSSQAFPEYAERAADTESLFELFYGMEYDSTGRYFDATLDSVPGLIHKEFCAVWLIPEDTVSFDMTIGLYIDHDFPSPTAKRIILEKVDSLLTLGMKFDVPEDTPISLKEQGVTPLPDSAPELITAWDRNFGRLTKANNPSGGDAGFQRVLDSRGCVVCHRIYEDSRWVTYILENSVSYHVS